jgi:hypothetical protein
VGFFPSFMSSSWLFFEYVKKIALLINFYIITFIISLNFGITFRMSLLGFLLTLYIICKWRSYYFSIWVSLLHSKREEGCQILSYPEVRSQDKNLIREDKLFGRCYQEAKWQRMKVRQGRRWVDNVCCGNLGFIPTKDLLSSLTEFSS